MKHNQALFKAIREYNLEKIDEAVQNGADINHWFQSLNRYRGYTTPLFEAVSSGSTQVTLRVLDHGADVDYIDQYGDTALHCAIRADESPTMIKALIEADTDIHHRNMYGNTPLDVCHPHAIHFCEFVKDLVDAGADINDEKFARLQVICELEDECIPEAEFLIKMGLDINRKPRTRDGKYPLMIAIENRNLDMVRCLVEMGADVNVCKSGRTPLDYSHTKEITKYLVQAGATRVRRGGVYYLDKYEHRKYLVQMSAAPVLTLKRLCINLVYRLQISHDHIPQSCFG